MNNNKSLLRVIFLTTLIDMLGIGLIIPVVTPLLLDPKLPFMSAESTFADRTMMIGFLLASFSLAQFVGSSLLGALSDRHGRKPILRYTVAGTLLSYLIFGIGIVQAALPLLFLGRLMLGFCSGNLAVTFSAIADLSSAEHKSRNFGMVGAAFGIGFVLGPFLGGLLSDSSWHPALGYDTPFWAAAVLSAVNLWVLQRYFTETLVAPRMSPLHPASGLRQIAKAFGKPELRGLFAVSFLMVFGFNFFTQFIQVYLIKRFDYGQGDIGTLFGYLGLWIALTQGLLLRPVSARISPAPILRVSLLLMGLAVMGILLPDQSVLLFAVLPLVSLGQGFSSPNLLSLISNKADSSMQGEILGINQSVNSFAQLLPPLIGGFIVAMDIRAPLLVSGSFIVLAWLTFITNRSYRS
ncbi:MAG: TCR/Tet family MFS transporter [Bacteroidetes bacterium]|nr:TCR/Tet family MFS transporter [Bacteroidota bacterium]